MEWLSTCGLSLDRKSTRLNSSHLVISYAVFCLKKKKMHFRIHAFDTNGMLMVSNIYSNVRILTNVVFQSTATEEIQYTCTNSALTSYLEVQMSVLEPHVLERYKAFPDPTVASNYLARQVGAVHLFQQRIPDRKSTRLN